MQKECNRCQNTFECDSTAINRCTCSTITIHPELTDYLKSTSYDCLCTNCLEELNTYPALAQQYPFPNHPTEYTQGIHYYLEGQYWVFTNFYHYLKGKCCKNNCRHCAYGYK